MGERLGDGDMRMLGARDGLAQAIVAIERELGGLYHYRNINPRHTRRIANRERIAAPLRSLAARLREQLADVMTAYEKSRAESPESAGE